MVWLLTASLLLLMLFMQATNRPLIIDPIQVLMHVPYRPLKSKSTLPLMPLYKHRQGVLPLNPHQK
jgi:hypothetical protein